MSTGIRIINCLKPYDVRKCDDSDTWHQYFARTSIINTDPGMRAGHVEVGIQHLMNSTIHYGPDCFTYKFMNVSKTSQMMVSDVILVDEVNKKLYLIRSPNLVSIFTIHEASVEFEKMTDGNRKVTKIEAFRSFVGHLDGPRNNDMVTFQWFLNQFDGSIFQVRSSVRMTSELDYTSVFIVSWIKPGDRTSVQIDGIPLPHTDGEVKVMAKYKLEFSQFTGLDDDECGILFSESGRKLLMRFRIGNPEGFDYSDAPLFGLADTTPIVKNIITSVELPFTHEMTKPPIYVLFGLNYNTNSIQLLTQFNPKSQENHADLLISARMLPIYANGMGFSNSTARSYLSQRSVMLGRYLKYTFLSTINKEAIGVVAVKSLIKTIQNGQLSLAPKKVWFPLEDDNVKVAFANLPQRRIKWDMLAQKHNVMLVVGKEFILEVFHPDIKKKPNRQLATIRVKLGDEFKDYRKCAGCGKIEENKRRSQNGKRISKLKVCGWCKDNKLHKTGEIQCHYCSKECADTHWPEHQLEHKKDKGKKSKVKKKKNKK